VTNPSRPSAFEDRYRLYLDESGDHVYRATNETAHRFLGLLGCWFNNADYLLFNEALEDLKRRHFHHHPDNPGHSAPRRHYQQTQSIQNLARRSKARRIRR
jgi:hypothetical protein